MKLHQSETAGTTVSLAKERTMGRLDYKWIVTISTIVGTFMTALAQTIVNISIPRLEIAFNAPLSEVQWVLTAYILAQGIFTPTSAYFSNRLGIKNAYLLSLGLFTISSALCGLALNLPMLIVFRVLQGAGGALLFPLTMTLMFKVFPANERGTAMGVFGIPGTLAPALGPSVGGFFATYLGWQYIFFINVPIGLIGFVAAYWYLKKDKVEATFHFDLPGFLLISFGLAILLYGLNNISGLGWNSPIVLALFGVGLVFLLLFVRVELNKIRANKTPLLDITVFRNYLFTFGNIVSILAIFLLYGVFLIAPIYLVNARQLSAFDAGLMLVPQAICSIVFSIIGGKLVDRVDARLVMIPGVVLMTIASSQLAGANLNTPYVWFILLLMVRGVGMGLTTQPLTYVTLSEVPLNKLSQATALNNVARGIGSALGVAIMTTILLIQTAAHKQALLTHPLSQAELSSRGLDAQGLTLGIQDTFTFTTILSLIVIVTLFFIRPSRKARLEIYEEEQGIPVQLVTSSEQ